MLASIPRLEDFDISPEFGFLPSELPLEVLPDPYYGKWETIIKNLQGLILSRRLRGVIDRLPVLSTIHLVTEAEWRRAYSILAFLCHAYIWGGDKPAEVIGFLEVLLDVSSTLTLPDCSSINIPTFSFHLRPPRPSACCNICRSRPVEL